MPLVRSSIAELFELTGGSLAQNALKRSLVAFAWQQAARRPEHRQTVDIYCDTENQEFRVVASQAVLDELLRLAAQ